MPLSEEQKLKYLQSKGLNPDEFEVFEVSPSALSPEPTATPSMSQGEAFGSRLKRSIGPGLLSLPAMAGGAALGAPIFPPFGAIGGAILGGIGGGYLGSKAQEPVMEYFQGSENYKKGLEEYQKAGEQFPVTSTAADIAPGFLAFGPGGLMNAIKGGGKALNYGQNLLLNAAERSAPTISNIEKEALINAAVNAGVNTGGEAVKQSIENDEPFDIKRLVTAGLLGTLQNKPYGPIGNKLFPTAAPAKVEPAVEAVAPVENVPVQTPSENVSPVPAETIPAPEEIPPVKQPAPNAEESPVLNKAKGKVREYNPLQQYEVFQQESTPDTQSNLTPEQLTKAQEHAKTRGVNLEEIDQLISNNTYTPARGAAIPAERRAIVSDIATSDTPYHEISGHIYARDLANSKLESDRRFYQRGLKAAGGDEEALAEALGKRMVDIDNAPLRSWLSDFWTNTKRLAKFGAAEDDIKLIARRAMDDRPYAESPELQGNKSPEIEQLKAKIFYSEDDPSSVDNTKEPSKSFVKPLTSLVDELKAKGGANKIAGEAYENFEKEQTRNTGKYTNAFLASTKKVKDSETAARYIWESRHPEIPAEERVKISPEDKAIIDKEIYPVYKQVHQDQRDLGLKIAGRDALDDPNLRGPNVASNKVLEILTTKPENDPTRQKLIQDFIEHKLKFKEASTEAEAKELLNTYLRGFASPSNESSAQYNALRKAQGQGIPWSWMEKDVNKIFQRYGNRVSRDFAFFKHIQDNPEARAVFNISDQFGKETKIEGLPSATGPEAKTALRRIKGEHTTNETLFNAIEHAVRSIILGPVTGIKNLAGTFQQILPYVSAKDLPKAIQAFKYIQRGMADSLAKGVNRHSITGLEVGEVGEGMGHSVADKLKIFGDTIRHWTGANYIEQVSRAHTMALGELLTESYWGRALSGDIDALRFIKQFNPDIKDIRSVKLTPEIIQETAANFTERVQGTYGGRGLPSFLLEPSSPAYWLMSLSKWGVEKSNVIKQDVINPALKGDYAPLMRYTLGAVFTGEAIRQISEAMFNKKQGSPNITETLDKGSADDYAYKAFELMWLAGYAGIVSDAIKMGADKYMGYKSRSPSIPSWEIGKEAIANSVNAMAAAGEGQPKLDIVMQLINDILIQNVQALRVAYNHTVGADEMSRADKFRDKRVYDRLSGKDAGTAPDNINRYQNISERKFKQADSTEEGQKIFEEDIKPRLDKLDPKERRKEVEGLRRNSYQIAPSDWLESQEYYDFIKRTQGTTAAEELKKNKAKQDRVNREKSRVVR